MMKMRFPDLRVAYAAVLLTCLLSGMWPWGAEAQAPDLQALRRALEDVCADYGEAYPQGKAYLRRLESFERTSQGGTGNPGELRDWAAFQREVLLDNPAMDFTRILAIKRHEKNIGLPQNWQGNSSLPRNGFENEIVLIPVSSEITPATADVTSLYRPAQDVYVGDLCLHWNADVLLFSSVNEAGRWQVFEMNVDGTGIQQVTPDSHADVDFYDACYLPDSRIMLCSTAAYTGVPCVYGGDHVANLFLLERGSGSIRQLCFDQDHNWSPRILPNGRVLYQRWEYSDTPHSNTRMLFHMNPDGTDQREYWGGGVYFPNSFFYARPLPGPEGRVIGVASGHHGTARSGRLLIAAPCAERGEGDGVIQEVPGRNTPVLPMVKDRLVDGVYPQFLHPYPITDKYFLVSAKMSAAGRWGIYLVDVFDNMTLLAEQEAYALMEPIPLRQETRPPMVPDRVDLQSDEAVVFMQDVSRGGGLEGIPPGTVKALRVFQYYFANRGQGGLLGTLGNDCGWDIKRVLGTVPVLEDGSACFKVPANTPISVQPLDAGGQALQIMRSWFTLQPGEQASCVGCHESQRTAPPAARARAFLTAPAEIAGSWHLPHRGFSFAREVQPVLDRYCAGCHGDSLPPGTAVPAGREFPYLRGDKMITDWSTQISGGVGQESGGVFSESYAALQRFVRRPGIESDLHMLSAMDFHVSTTELGQLLHKGHYNAPLDAESWERIATWIDLNAPYHGTWGETHPRQKEYAPTVAARALALRREFAPSGPLPDLESIPTPAPYDTAFVDPSPTTRADTSLAPISGWPFSGDQAAAMRSEAGNGPELDVELAPGVLMKMVLVPGGTFAMGSDTAHPDEGPRCTVKVAPFYLGQFEVTNEQYRAFDPAHESRDESRQGYQFGRRGFFMDAPGQPAVRVSWEEAVRFCEWMSTATGLNVALPSEAQWEWAARAGSEEDFYFGGAEADFSRYSNLADARLRDFAQCTARGDYERAEVIEGPSRHDDRIPRCDRCDDGAMISVEPGTYLPNPWNLHDMHGNVWEWTCSAYLPYPYVHSDGRNNTARPALERVARGGSWRDRPCRATASFRLPYAPYQKVFNVGFRVAVELDSPVPGTVAAVEPDRHRND